MHLTAVTLVSQVIMFDSCTGLTTAACCNLVIGNAVWGRVNDEDSSSEPTWECVSDQPSLKAPQPGLHSYAQYLSMLDKRADGSKEARKRTKDLAAVFTEGSGPGAAFYG